jgi:hypothetical protein
VIDSDEEEVKDEDKDQFDLEANPVRLTKAALDALSETNKMQSII